MTDTASHFPCQENNPPLEPATQEFVDGLAACNSQISELIVDAARAALYIPNEVDREVITATPLNATIDQLRGLPDALIIGTESDILRDGDEACA